MLTKNKFRTYLVYAVGEIMLVILGILIALQLNNWNENRKENHLKENYLQHLLLDLETDKIYCQNVVSTLESFSVEYDNYKKIYAEPGLEISDVITKLQNIPFGHVEIEFETSTIKTLISTGDIKLIPASLRNKLTAYYGNQNHIMTISNGNIFASKNILQDASMSGANPSLFFRLQNQPQFMEYLDLESKVPKMILELEACLTWKESGEEGTTRSLNRLIKDADTIIAGINQELEK